MEYDGERWISYGFEPADVELRQTIHYLDGFFVVCEEAVRWHSAGEIGEDAEPEPWE
jgi:hypothetical protein